METTETFKKVFINGDEKNLPKPGREYVMNWRKYNVVQNLEFIDTPRDIKTWLEDIDWYLSPINEAQGKEELPEINLHFFRSNILRRLTKEEFIILRDWMNSYDPEFDESKVDQPKEQPEPVVADKTAKQFIIETYGESWLHADWTAGDVMDAMDDFAELKLSLRAAQGKGKEQPERRRTADLKQKYVVGFMFPNDPQRVVLIRKNKPAWQAGLLNGVGGKIEAGETPLQAMYREYKEEAGVGFGEWNNFLTIEYRSCVVYFFKGFSRYCFAHSRTMESEVIEKIYLNKFPKDEVIPNLNWIINLALDPDISKVEAVEDMQEYAREGVPMISDEDLEKEFPTDYDSIYKSVEFEDEHQRTQYTLRVQSHNSDRQRGAKWAISRMNQTNKEK